MIDTLQCFLKTVGSGLGNGNRGALPRFCVAGCRRNDLCHGDSLGERKNQFGKYAMARNRLNSDQESGYLVSVDEMRWEIGAQSENASKTQPSHRVAGLTTLIAISVVRCLQNRCGASSAGASPSQSSRNTTSEGPRSSTTKNRSLKCEKETIPKKPFCPLHT